MKDSDYVDIYGLNYKGLNKQEAINLYLENYGDVKPYMFLINTLKYNSDLQPVMSNDKQIGYVWRPCAAVEYILSIDEVLSLLIK